MATSAASLYPTGTFAGIDLSKVRTSIQGPEFVLGTRVRLNRAKVAMYVRTSTVAIPPSASIDGSVGTGWTVSTSEGPYISMNDATTVAGQTNFLWIRSSADALVP